MSFELADKQEKISNSIQSMLLSQFTTNFGGGQPVDSIATVFSNLRYYLTSQFRQQLSYAYAEIGLIASVVDIPVDHGLRGGLKIKTKQLEEEEIDLLISKMEREQDLKVLADALKWERLFGGSGIITNTGTPANTPLKIEAVEENSLLGFIAADLWELNGEADDKESYSMNLDLTKASHIFFHGIKVDRSRVDFMRGIEPPSLVRPRTRGFGLSVVERLLSAVNRYLKSINLSFEVLDEFKIDIFKIKDLNASSLDPLAEAAMQNRLQTANMQKNFQHALTMDKEDDYDHKQLSFAGLAEVMEGIYTQAAFETRIPKSILFGTGSTGFSTGADDLENFNAMIESDVRAKAKYPARKMVELRCMQLFGFIPSDLKIDFYPMRVLTAEQEENVKNAKASRISQFRAAGLISVKEAKDTINKSQLLDIQIEVDDELHPVSPGGDVGAMNVPEAGSSPAEPKEPK